MHRLTALCATVLLPCASAVAGEGPADIGQWQAPQDWDVIAIHAALLPTGEVLQYSYPWDTPDSRARTWNPQTGQFTEVNWSLNLFCSGLTFLADGRLLVTGGNDNPASCPAGHDFRGHMTTSIFDPFTNQWTFDDTMSTGRWYPSNVMLGDGRVMIFSGLSEDCVETPIVEMFTPGIGVEVIANAERFTNLFPRMHLLSSGRIAHVGENNCTYTYDPLTEQWTFIDCNNYGWRGQGTSVLMPGEIDVVMIMGGHDAVGGTQTCEIIDFKDAVPQWSFAANMNFGRAHANAVTLPNKKVIIIGGGGSDLYGDPQTTPELYDPVLDEWKVLPPQVHGRMYHSTAVLLPDGRVLSAGQDNGPSAWQAEIYEPPYLFQGPRPTLSWAPNSLTYGVPFDITTPNAESIDSVVLIALSAVTHSVNMNQRLVELDFVQTNSSTLLVTAPAHGNLAPPGFYMLFILDDSGVPAIAPIVQLVHAPVCSTVADCADLDHDGIRDDNCVWYECIDGACSGTSTVFADMGGQFGACAIDGTTDGNDRFHALNCFANQDPGGGEYTCEPNAPDALNVDAGGPFGSCASDGVCDGNDAFHASTMFEFTNMCADSCAGGPAPTITPTVVGQATITLDADRRRIRPGDTVAVTVRLRTPVNDLRGYQLHVTTAGGRSGTLDLVDISVEDAGLFSQRHDPMDYWSAFNVATGQMIVGLSGSSSRVEPGAMATYTFTASKDAVGPFAVELRHQAPHAGDRTFMFMTAPHDKIELSTQPITIHVEGQRGRAR